LCKLHAVVLTVAAVVTDLVPYRVSTMLRYGSLSELAVKGSKILLGRT
jgi:hypothetical protein